MRREGDPVALVSLAAIPLAACDLVLTEHSPQWVHTHVRPRRMSGDV